ncbi:MAG: hypothetical protein ACJ76I_07560 [Gaiellaceae bacterium]
MLLLAVVILSACGGSGAPKVQSSWKAVSGSGFRFEAPSGWRTESAGKLARAAHDGELVQVTTFPLVKPYNDGLFAKVQRELRARMQTIARQTRGKVTAERTVTAAGIRSHSYEVTTAGHVDEYTFVLRGKREYLLLCRRKAGDRSFCAQLVKSFAV